MMPPRAIMKAIRSAMASRHSGVEIVPIRCEEMSSAPRAVAISSWRGGLVEPVPCVGSMVYVLDAQHRVGIPELVGLQRFADDVDQRRLVGMLERVAVPVGHGAIEFYRAVCTEIEHALQTPVVAVGG